MADILLHRAAVVNRSQTEHYWSTDHRTTFKVVIPTGDDPGQVYYDYGRGNLVDAWCSGSTREDVIYQGSGQVKTVQTLNSDKCSLPPCGLSITGVDVTGEELSGPNATATIHTSGGGTLEYSLNNFADLQSSNVFPGLSIGSYIAYARPVGQPHCTATFPFEIQPTWQVRWRLEYPVQSGQQVRVDIEDRSYTGAPTFLTGTPDFAVLEYPEIGNKWDALGGSGLTIEFLHGPSIDLTDFYTADERKFRVNLYEDNVLKWRGYLLPEWYEEPWVAKETRPTVRLVASDGIAALRDVYYVVENGFRYYGRATQLDVLRRCLDKLDLDLPFYTAINIWAEGMDTTLDPLAQAYVEQDGYYDGTTPLGCGEVLERILNPYLGFVRQQGGALHIIPHQARKDVYTRRQYTAAGDYVGIEDVEFVADILRNPVDADDVSYRLGAQVVGVEPAITLGRTTTEYGNLKNFVKNGNFDDWNGNSPNSWLGDMQTTRALSSDGKGFRLAVTRSGNLGTSLVSAPLSYRQMTDIQISFDYEFIIDTSSTDAFFDMKVEVGGKWVQKGVNDYSATLTNAPFRAVYVPTDGQAGFRSVTGSFYAFVRNVPADGDIKVTLLPPGSKVGTSEITLLLDNLKVEPYLLSNVRKMHIEGTNPGYNTVKPFELTLHHGSGIPQSESLITRADFTPTDLWGEGVLLQEYTLRQILTQHSYPVRVLRGTITRGNAIGVLRDPFMPTARFGVDSYILNYGTGLANFTARELFGGPEEAPPLFGFYTEDGKPIMTENYHYITLKV